MVIVIVFASRRSLMSKNNNLNISHTPFRMVC